ncbi:MAG TPA: hypothetical protein VH684_30550 [Xanthobacteraceae bacterium]|jgi:REP element-mobilizing transposase RayT
MTEIARGFRTFPQVASMSVPGKRGVLWQRGYCERIIRDEKALDPIRAYIANNPARWEDDPENISRAEAAQAGRV